MIGLTFLAKMIVINLSSKLKDKSGFFILVTIKAQSTLATVGRYLLDYTDYLEDTIFCNDRSIRSLNGWNPNGGSVSSSLQFMEYNVTSDLSCANITDQFSTQNEKAKLTYPVGLMTSPEMNLLGNSELRRTGQYYWLASPVYFINGYASGRNVDSAGVLSGSYVGNASGVRPAVSLKLGTEYSSGNGSMESPYVVALNN